LKTLNIKAQPNRPYVFLTWQNPLLTIPSTLPSIAYRGESEVAELALWRVFFVVEPPRLSLQRRDLVFRQVELVGVAKFQVDGTEIRQGVLDLNQRGHF